MDDLKIAFIVALFFIMFSVFVPVYDTTNGFHNIMFDDYKLVWYDGRSPVSFYLIKNGTFLVSPNTTIAGIPMEYQFDFKKVGDLYIPMHNILPEILLMPLSFLNLPELGLFKSLIFLNIILYAMLLSLFYLIQRMLGLNKKYSVLSTVVAGIATSILVYSKYLFLQETFCTLIFMFFILVIFKTWNKKSLKKDAVITIILLLFCVFFHAMLVPVLLVLFVFLFQRYKVLHNIKYFMLFSVLISILPYVQNSIIFGPPYTIIDYNFYPIKGYENLIFQIYPDYTPAIDYDVYGYHDASSMWKMKRSMSFIYGFENEKGNAIFLFSHGVFQSLFGPKGFVFNSPFLIFSILGLFVYKDKKKRNFLLAMILFFIIAFGLYFGWFGGFIPRYVRYFNIPILLLSFFSFYCIQETRSKIVKLIFSILVVLSVLNVASLAVRADWNYQHEIDLVSYDLVLWPWYSPKLEEMGNKTTIQLTTAEIYNWRLGGENGCKAEYTDSGLMTDPCFCTYNSWAERKVHLDKNISKIGVKACSVEAGDDGTRGFVYIDDKLVGELFIDSHSCNSGDFPVSILAGGHTIKLMSGQYGNCSAEMTYWKTIVLESE